MKNKKGSSLVEYVMLFIMTAAIIGAIVYQFNPDIFKNLFKYTFDFKNEMGNGEVQIGPLTD
jgi:hypothetical protein